MLMLPLCSAPGLPYQASRRGSGWRHTTTDPPLSHPTSGRATVSRTREECAVECLLTQHLQSVCFLSLALYLLAEQTASPVPTTVCTHDICGMQLPLLRVALGAHAPP
jgi:hypothetical protein